MMKSLHLDSGVLFVLIYFQFVGQQDVVGEFKYMPSAYDYRSV